MNTRSNCARIKKKGTSATDSPKSVTRAKGVPRSATALPCIGPERLRPSSPSATERIKPNMKKIIPASATWIWAITAFFVFSNAPHAFAKPQKKPAGSSQENVGPLVSAAMKDMESGVWSVKGTVMATKTIKLQGLLAGEDCDLTTEPGVNPNTPMREIVIKNKGWICSDGETWHATRPDDRLIYNWAHVPIMAGGGISQMPFEKVGTEQRDGQTWLQVRMKVPEKNIKPKELPQYWLVLDSQGQAQYIGHTEMPMFSQARKEVMYCSFDYAPAKEKIQPPPLGAPIDDKAYGFNDIEQHKFDWKGRVVRLEVTPKILESKQIGADTYRGFFKDTATPNHYGIVEFPHDALVKLGFLKKIVSGTHATEELEKMGAIGRTDGKSVSFYVEVIPIGEKPAARAVAVGARLVRDPDGSVSYTWESDEKQTAKSPPAPAEPDASDGDLVNRGIEKAKNGDLDGAIADFDRAIQLDPKDAAIYNNRGLAKQAKGDFNAAIADFNRAIELNPKDAVAYSNRGNTKRDKGDLDGAILDYNHSIRVNPKYAYAYYDRGLAKKQKSDLDGAIADYNRVIELDPRFAKAYCDRGVAKRRKGDLDGAISDYNRTIELDHKYAIAYFNRGNAKAEKGDLEGAIADYDRGIELNPKYASAYYNRAYTKQTKGDIDGAVADYTRAIELNPKDPVAYNDRGVARQRKDDFPGAIAEFNHAIELNPKYAAAHANRANAKAQYDDWDGAIADLDRAIKLESKNAVAYYERAYAKRQKKDAAGAIADYTRAIELDGKDADFHKERGDVWLEKKQYHPAIDDIQKAIQLDPKNGDYYSSLGWYQLFNRKPRESIAASLKALELSPDNAVMIKGNLAHGYLFDNHFDKAKAIYLENKDAKLQDGRPFSQSVLDDFKEFQEAGITHPDTEKIKALLTTNTEAR